MKRMIPIFISIMIVLSTAYMVFVEKHKESRVLRATEVQANIGAFDIQRSCAKLPDFLKRMKISEPVIIDLSQKRFKGIALYHGKNFQEILHPKMWEKYEHFSTYALDRYGNIFLAPSPFISITSKTFDLQTNIYKLDSKTGQIEIFMYLKDVHPSAYNPHGINTVVYDCDDESLWVSAIDETTYEKQRGVIYHIDIKTKTVLQKLEGLDALTLALVSGEKGKYLLVGAGRESALYAYEIIKNRAVPEPKKLFSLPDTNQYMRKIKIKSKNRLELQTIPFMYSLIAETSKKDRKHHIVRWDEKQKKWMVQ